MVALDLNGPRSWLHHYQTRGFSKPLVLILAALEAQIKMKHTLGPQDPGRKRPKTTDLENGNPAPPPGAPGGGGAKIKIKNRLKHSQVLAEL